MCLGLVCLGFVMAPSQTVFQILNSIAISKKLYCWREGRGGEKNFAFSFESFSWKTERQKVWIKIIGTTPHQSTHINDPTTPLTWIKHKSIHNYTQNHTEVLKSYTERHKVLIIIMWHSPHLSPHINDPPTCSQWITHNTHTCTHTDVHIHTNIPDYKHYLYTNTCTHTNVFTQTHTYSQTFTYTKIQTRWGLKLES